jgi:hypothetical protein
MSGEVVVVNAVSGAAIGAAAACVGLIAVGGIAYQILKAQQQEKRREAEIKAREEKRQMQVWQKYHDTQQQLAQELNSQRQIVRDAFSQLRLHLQEEKTSSDSNNSPNIGARAHSFLAVDESSQVQQRLQQLQSWLKQLPAQLTTNENSPAPLLQARLAQLNTQSARLETVVDFIETAKRSITQFSQHLEEQQRQQTQALQQAEAQLDELLNYQALAQAGVEAEELNALQTHLVAILGQNSLVASLNSLALLQKKFASLKQQIDDRLEQQATEAVIYQRVAHHLQAMGYTAAGQEQERVQSWSIPGGEQVRFALQPDFKLSFQVAHERTRKTDAALSLQERAFLHQQEHKWCQDLPKLIKKLQEDGLNYQVDFERRLPDDGIPIVVLETAEELLAAEEDEAARLQHSAKRYLNP